MGISLFSSVFRAINDIHFVALLAFLLAGFTDWVGWHASFLVVVYPILPLSLGDCGI